MSEESTKGGGPGQARKIRIIEKTFGSNWRDKFPNKAVDAVYNIAISDNRRSVFFKIQPELKDKLDEMINHYDATIGDFIGMLIDQQYEIYLEQRRNIVLGMAGDYSGIVSGG